MELVICKDCRLTISRRPRCDEEVAKIQRKTAHPVDSDSNEECRSSFRQDLHCARKLTLVQISRPGFTNRVIALSGPIATKP
jgi:hypothetical protein